MDHIRQALQRATESPQGSVAPLNSPRPPNPNPASLPPASASSDYDELENQEVELRHKELEQQRIVAHNNADPRSRSFDMLRTQTLQAMGLKEWQLVGVTSATPGCGKTHTALNLAMSIARQHERSVLLVDLDLQKPQVASRLQIKPKFGVLSVLDGTSSIEQSITRVRVGNLRLNVLPCEKFTSHSSERMASAAMGTLLRELKLSDPARIIIVDLPPVLIGDNVLSILPHIDCVLFVASIGVSTISEITECNKHLQATSVIRIALNKSSEMGPAYYGYY